MQQKYLQYSLDFMYCIKYAAATHQTREALDMNVYMSKTMSLYWTDNAFLLISVCHTEPTSLC